MTLFRKPCIVTALFVTAATVSAQDSVWSVPVSEDDRPFLLHYPNLENPDGRVVLTNEFVVLQRLWVPAGEWEGIHSHPGNQIYVHIMGGEWSGRLGGEIEYWGIASPDGEVGWMDPIPLSAGHESGNTGDTPIDLIYVTLKKAGPIADGAGHGDQSFSDAFVDLLIENERMIVQRVHLEPGWWTGPHVHTGRQIIIYTKGGTRSERRGDQVQGLSKAIFPGSAVWMEGAGTSEVHDVGNSGDSLLEFVLVTIK